VKLNKRAWNTYMCVPIGDPIPYHGFLCFFQPNNFFQIRKTSNGWQKRILESRDGDVTTYSSQLSVSDEEGERLFKQAEWYINEDDQ
jgi:hypothetical protein